MLTILKKTEDALARGKRVVLCTVTGSTGSTPRKAGSKMGVCDDGTVFGSIGGGSVEYKVIGKAREMMGRKEPETIIFNLEEDLSMPCGGSMTVFIDPVNPPTRLYIFGAGHIGKALAVLSGHLNFTVTLIDPRPGIFNDPCFSACTCLNKDYFEAIAESVFSDQDFLVIATHRHIQDEEILAVVALKPHAYLGMVGSKRKVTQLRERFLKDGILQARQLDLIDMPIGIKFRAETPEEIAVSILARMIDVRNSPSEHFNPETDAAFHSLHT